MTVEDVIKLELSKGRSTIRNASELEFLESSIKSRALLVLTTSEIADHGPATLKADIQSAWRARHSGELPATLESFVDGLVIAIEGEPAAG